MEQALGHVTHHQNLERWVENDPEINAHWMPVPQTAPDLWERIPVVRSNWTLKASLRARALMMRGHTAEKLDAVFWHTQTTALFSPDVSGSAASVVSLDATPINYDTVGAAYGHAASGSAWLERLKHQLHTRTFHRAAALVTWCSWAKRSLISDYGVSSDKISVIPPGIDLEQWSVERAGKRSGKARLLFVGGDFERKGGPQLVAAFGSRLEEFCTLDVVTKEPIWQTKYGGIAGLTVHCGLNANSAPLRRLYAEADLFVFPTRADCLPIAVMEAMAAGLPVVATDVGALSEEVEHGRNGLMVPLDDVNGLVEAVISICGDPGRLRAMSQESRKLARERFDARTNYGMVLSLLKECAAQSQQRRMGV